jgi:hypothetical protein
VRDELQARLDELNGEGLTVPEGASPVDFMMAVYRDIRQPMERRLRAARECAPYVHPKLSTTAVLIDGGSFAERLQRSIERTQKVLDLQAVEETKAGEGGED